MKPTGSKGVAAHERALNTTTKRTHRAQYRPSRQANHCDAETYLRPDQVAKSLYFEYIHDYKKPTIRSVHARRLTSLRDNAAKATAEATRTSALHAAAEMVLGRANEALDIAHAKVTKATAWSVRCTTQYTATALAETRKAVEEHRLMHAKQVKAATTAAQTKMAATAAAAEARLHIENGAQVEIDSRMSRSINKVNVLVGELRGVEVEELEMEDDHILSSALPGSPRKYHGPKRQTAKEIIDRRKKRNKLRKAQMNATEQLPSEVAFAAQQMERLEKRKLGLERQERCYMCHLNYPKYTMQDEVIEKCVYKWRQQQKAVRCFKKEIRTSIQSLGDGGAAIVFRFAAKSRDVQVEPAKKTMAMVKRVQQKFMKSKIKRDHQTQHHQPSRPATASSFRKSKRHHSRNRRHQNRKSQLPTSSSTAALKLANASSFKSTAPGSISFDQFFQAMNQMFSINISNEHVKNELLKWLDRDGGGDLSYTEFQHLVNVGEDEQGGKSSEQYSATPGSERRPQLVLEKLDHMQPEMLVKPMRLVHTLYEKVTVCGFCMQLLHADAFRRDDETKDLHRSRHGKKEDSRIEEQSKSGTATSVDTKWSPRALPTTFTTPHNPWGWEDIRQQIVASFVTRRAVVPFETWQEHQDVGRSVKHYMSFNHVPMPSRKGGRKPVVKQITLASVASTSTAVPASKITMEPLPSGMLVKGETLGNLELCTSF